MLTYFSWLYYTFIQIKSNLYLLKSRYYRIECADCNVLHFRIKKTVSMLCKLKDK